MILSHLFNARLFIRISVLLTLSTFYFLPNAHGSFMVSMNSGYHSNSDGKNNYSFKDMTHHFFLGAGLGSKDQLFLGQNITSLSTEYKTSATTKISTLELGPRLIYYFNADKNILLTLAWNPYAKGERTTLAGATQDISGSSLMAGLGLELKMSQSFYLGASLMYHSLSVSKYEVNKVSTEVSESYTSITPMMNLCFRFR